MAELLPVMESFYTLQGEGFHQGMASYFIRLGGCDVGCVWCDVKESWPMDVHPKKSIQTLLTEVLDSGTPNVVITGGEPSMHDLRPLTDALQAAGKQVWIETAGTNTLLGSFDWICVSPKKFKPVLPENLGLAHELKVIVYNKNDFKWAESHRNHVSDDCLLYLQPEWSREREMLPLIVEYVKKHPAWRISLQSHKYMRIP